MNGIHNSLSIEVHEDAGAAIAAGRDYGKDKNIRPIRVESVVIVRKGTAEGNPTVDFVMVDETGQKFVFMVTGRLLKSIPC